MKPVIRRLLIAMRKLRDQTRDVSRVAHEARLTAREHAVTPEFVGQLSRTHEMLLVITEDLEAWTRKLEALAESEFATIKRHQNN